MGSCASTEYASKGGNFIWLSTVNIVHLDGRSQQLKEPTKAWVVLSQNPNSFICCSESMYVGSPMPPMAPTQELQLGHVYFIVLRSKSRILLSLEDLCSLTIKVDAALVHSQPTYQIFNSPSPVTQKKFKVHPVLSSVSQGYSH
ncbi:hypothetical protein TanjilG_03372 [Lupinus angustifolius]|uniref:Uncharacterized protein n=1 Tax=Lupinus angustifolius TaxID=3871 RepID=A0A4P1RDP1_LUPAN|nr:PREDICTED: uncharacterized protein LOC109351527 [Lupinus angustifolius]OIW08696.1 hypothetical protein TanjilG_03372 [Lupinus angustifolius]